MGRGKSDRRKGQHGGQRAYGLEKMVRQHRIKRLRPSADETARLLLTARRRLDDAANISVHPETRLEQAYQAILTCAMLALRASGFRASSSRGHHITMLESLEHTLRLDEERVGYYQALRSLRHQSLYEGWLELPADELGEALSEARWLLAGVEKWLAEEHGVLYSTALSLDPESLGKELEDG